jgi:hypothetical protein
MSLNLQNQALTLPNGTEFPGTMQDFVNLVAQYMAIAGQGAFSGINFGPTTPSPSDQDKPWFKTDNLGNPIGWYTWNGSSWVQLPLVAQSGTTGQRPVTGTIGQLYFDTTIKVLLRWNGSTWITADGAPNEVRFVGGSDTAVILTYYPGWVILTALAGYVIGVAGDGTGHGLSNRTAGQVVGEETHALTATENGPHTHGYTTYGTLHGTSGANPIFANPVSGTTDGGGANGTPHNNMQPTWFLYAIQKSP